MLGHPAPHFSVEENQGQHSRNDSFPQIGVRVHSRLPVRPVIQERWGLPRVGVDGSELKRSHAACLPRKHMKESCVCREAEGEGALTARQRVADGEMQPIFSPQPKLLFKDWAF